MLLQNDIADVQRYFNDWTGSGVPEGTPQQFMCVWGGGGRGGEGGGAVWSLVLNSDQNVHDHHDHILTWYVKCYITSI